ncbi:hypothetical protein Tco_0577673 [Tanacetum coccineum]
MFLNMDQLQKQLDNNEFQEIGSMDSFKVLETQFQMFIKSKIYLNDEYIVMTHNYFLQYTQLDIPEFRETLVQFMEYVKKSIDERALHKREHDSRVNERQMQTTMEKVDTSKALDASSVIIKSNGTESQEQDTSSRSGNDAHVWGGVLIAISNLYMMKSQRLRWVPTGKIFTSSTTKVDNEPPNGSKEDIITNVKANSFDVSAGTLLSTASFLKRTIVSVLDNSDPCPDKMLFRQKRRQILTTWVDFLFSTLLVEYLQSRITVMTVATIRFQAPNASFQEVNLSNLFCTRVQEFGSLLIATLILPMCYSFQLQSRDLPMDRVHPLKQVVESTMTVQTRRQLSTVLNSCMIRAPDFQTRIMPDALILAKALLEGYSYL